MVASTPATITNPRREAKLVRRVCAVCPLPVIAKLTPNVTDITHIALAAERGGADAVSLINTINSLMGVNLDTFAPAPNVAG